MNIVEEVVTDKCKFMPESKYVSVGWGCCKCKTYNGLQRKFCKRCGHEPCVELPKPHEFGLCDECGVPAGIPHRGHQV